MDGGKMNETNREAITQLADQIKAGDDALNKLKVQNLDFHFGYPSPSQC
jgi:flagellar motor switch protein FliN